MSAAVIENVMSNETEHGHPSRRVLDSALATIERRFGLEFPAYKIKEFLFRVKEASAACGMDSIEDFLAGAAAGVLGPEALELLAGVVTVCESYFFRHPEQIELIARELLPRWDRVLPPGEPVRVWSAGCARGEEPFSIVISRELDHGCGRPWEIIGTDVNANALERARQGLYHSWSLRSTPPLVKQCFFTGEGQDFVLSPRVRDQVKFLTHNLAAPLGFNPFGPGVPIHLIVCRNVLYYFSSEYASRVLSQFIFALAPGGHLILSPGEIIPAFNLPLPLTITSRRGVLIYQKPLSPHGPWAVPEDAPARSPVSFPEPRCTPDPPADLKPDLATAIETAAGLRDQGDWRRALAEFGPFSGSLEAAIFKARLLLGFGGPAEARASSEALLRNHPGHVAGYFFHAMICQREGDLDGAVSWLRRSLYLNPDFVAGHLQLALVLHQQGKDESSSRAWKNAERILDRLDPAAEVPFADGGRARDLLRLVRDREGKDHDRS